MAKDVGNPSIKIVDDGELRNQIVERCNRIDDVAVTIWAGRIVKDLLRLVDFNEIDRTLIEQGLAALEQWPQGYVTVFAIRQIGFQLHQRAREVETIEQQLALRTIGHAISSAHMREHAIVASDYQIKLYNSMNNDDMDKVKDTRNRQLKMFEGIS